MANEVEFEAEIIDQHKFLNILQNILYFWYQTKLLKISATFTVTLYILFLVPHSNIRH